MLKVLVIIIFTCLTDHSNQAPRCWFLFVILCSGLKSSIIKRWRRCCRHLRAVRATDWKIQRGKNGNIDKRNLPKRFKSLLSIFKEVQTFSEIMTSLDELRTWKHNIDDFEWQWIQIKSMRITFNKRNKKGTPGMWNNQEQRLLNFRAEKRYRGDGKREGIHVFY